MTDNKPSLAKGYGPEHYNSQLVLKVPFFLALSMAWLARNLIVPFMAGVISQKTHSNDLAQLVFSQSTLLFAASSFPALLVLYAWGKRMPPAGNIVRWIWRHARPILALSSLVDLLLHYLLIPKLTKGFMPATLLLDFYILVYLGLSQRVKLVFADFPVASDS